MSNRQTSTSLQINAAIVPLLRQYGSRLGLRTIAKIARELYPELFLTTEAARGAIRYRMGTKGVDSRSNRSIEHVELANEINRATAIWPVQVESFLWKPYDVPDLDGLWLIIADLHIPFHETRPIMATIQHAKSLGKALKGIIILGDLLDQYNASWWPIDPMKVSYESELRCTREFIYKLKEEFPKCKIIYKMANHERRFEKVVMSTNPVLAANKSARSILTLGNILCAQGNDDLLNGIDVVSDGNILAHKELALIHGDEFGKGMGNPVSPARTLFLKARACAIQAHSHMSSGFTKGNIWGNQITTKSIGCLCQLHAHWKPMGHTEWNHGFAVLDTRRKWDVMNYRIFDMDKVVSA